MLNWVLQNYYMLLPSVNYNIRRTGENLISIIASFMVLTGELDGIRLELLQLMSGLVFLLSRALPTHKSIFAVHIWGKKLAVNVYSRNCQSLYFDSSLWSCCFYLRETDFGSHWWQITRKHITADVFTENLLLCSAFFGTILQLFSQYCFLTYRQAESLELFITYYLSELHENVFFLTFTFIVLVSSDST